MTNKIGVLIDLLSSTSDLIWPMIDDKDDKRHLRVVPHRITEWQTRRMVSVR